jgi:hypothetical protein
MNLKKIHTEEFLKIYAEEFQQPNSKLYIDKLLKETMKKVSKLNIYIYEKYIINNEPCNTIITDFTIIGIANGNVKEFYIHSMILESNYFCILIDGEFKQQKSITIEVSSFKIIDILLKYLYLSEIDFTNITIDEITELHNLSDEYEFESLIVQCNWGLKEKLFGKD